ncbi:MAG TPA: MFS transporter [Croceibacterium sp.]|nr:MFS transporter [Croceibacterium sp.]
MIAEPLQNPLEGRPVRAFQLVVVGTVMLALALDGLDYQLLALVSPLILDEWDVTRADFGPAMAAALFGMAIGAAAGGWVGDRVGRLRSLVAATLLFGAVTMLVSRADTLAELAALRVLGGIGFGAAGPNAIALASEWVPARLRTYVVALLAIGTPLGGMLAALLVPALLPAAGWRGIFLLFGAVATAFALAMATALRESPSWLAAHGRLDASRGAARRIVPDGLANTAESGPAPRLFAREFLRLNVGIGLGFAALTAIVYGLGAWLPATLTAAGFSLEQALRASLALSASSIAGALAAGYLARAVGSRVLMAASALGTCLGLVALGLLLDAVAGAPGAGARGAVIALTGVVGAIASIGITTLYAMAALLFPPAIRSGGIGLGMTMGRIGGIAMSFAGGALLDFAAGSALVLFGVLAISALLALASAFVVQQHIAPSTRRAAGT